ncbi:hypothetical protein HanXRQr2_Chr02g0058791 [Helianthus annuus]|uniref:Uncharacterized protein n=2 Tax=Helianthus annuus TaxID=4232 RepID=A0A9K3JNX9_HELAN|nr:hypothetical protein HanXRQr2_Chr02g0058791 [Helianthus annuus]
MASYFSSLMLAAREAMEEETNGYRRHHSYSGSIDSGNIHDDASKLAGQRFSVTPYISTRVTPTATPKTASASVCPRRYSASGTTSPTKIQYESHITMSSWYPSSQQSSAGNSPPRGPPIPEGSQFTMGKVLPTRRICIFKGGTRLSLNCISSLSLIYVT